MNDLDDRVREELHRLAEPVRSRIEREVVVEAGGRRRRARRAGWASAGVGAIAVLVVGVAALVGGRPGDVVAASPAPASPTFRIAPPAMSTFTPGPVDGASSEGWSRTTELPGLAGGGLGFDSVTVTGEYSGDAVVVSGSRKGTAVTRRGEVVAGDTMVAKLNDRVWVVASRGEVTWVEGSVSGGGLGLTATYGQGDLSVFVITGEPRIPLAGYIWRGRDGKIRDDKGQRVPAGVVAVGERSFWFTHDTDLRIACGGEVKGGVWAEDECSDLTVKDGTGLNTDLAEAGGGSGTGKNAEEVVFLVLPEGASDWSAGSLSGCSVSGSVLDPGGRILLVSVCKGAGDGGADTHPPIHYRAASGRMVTYR